MNVYVVTHGDYSDYCVECVFEREKDAKAYVELANTADVRRHHKAFFKKNDPTSSPWVIREREFHAQPFEECEACQKELAQGDQRYGAYRVERFPFHTAGEVPHMEAIQ